MAVAIKGKPTGRVADLTRPVRADLDDKTQGGAWRMSTSWRISSWDGDDDNPRRMQGVDLWFHFNASDGAKKTVQSRSTQRNVAGDVVWVRDIEGTSFEQQYARSAYHPAKEGRYLNSVTVQAAGWNSKGSSGKVAQTYAFQKPRVPTLSEPELNESTGALSTTLKSDEGTDACERFDTQFCVVRQDSANRNNQYKAAKIVSGGGQWSTTREIEVTLGQEVSDHDGINLNEWIKITFRAKARGLKGDSAIVEKSHVFAHPAIATFVSINATSLAATGTLMFRIKTNHSTYRPVDQVKLQMLRNTDVDSAADAAIATGWADVSGAVDDRNCTGFSQPVSDAIPERGKRTWYRLVTTRDTKTQTGNPVEAAMLYREAPAANAKVGIVDVRSTPDGDGLAVSIGWNDDESTGTELSWSTRQDAWTSNTPPETVNVTWEGHAYDGWEHGAVATIYGLETDVPVYVKARRYHEGDTVTYGKYALAPDAKYPMVPAIEPHDIALTVPSYIRRGEDIPVSWTFAGSLQTRWAIGLQVGFNYLQWKQTGGGEGSSARDTIPASAYEGLDSFGVKVGLFTGLTSYAWSEVAMVSVADAPTLELPDALTATAQPLTFAIGTNDADAEVVAALRAAGVTAGRPDGPSVQAEGDVLWSGVVRPGWEQSGDGYAASLALPDYLPLVNGASYVLEAKAVNPGTGLASDALECAVDIAWAHAAEAPTGTVVTEPGMRRARITPAAPDGAPETDVCDVYRKTADGCYLIAESIAFGDTVIDRFAPFGDAELAYRLATRTVDGDVNWTDVAYEMRATGVRLDWANKSVELPFNVEWSDSWSKDFEQREHLDGSVAGRWNPAVTRSLKVSSDMVKRLDSERAALVREVAQYAGSVFVRLSNGCAFQANAEVDDLSGSMSQRVPVSVALDEVDLTAEFMVRPEDVRRAGEEYDEYGDDA